MAYATKKKLSDNSIVPLGSNLYGTCSTAKGTATKTVSMPDFNVLVEGVTIHVYFANENTASSPKLKVGSTDAKPIHYNGQARGSWDAGGFISFTYYSGSWHQNDITVAGVTYTFTINDHTMTISGSDGSVQTITIPDTTYTLSKSGSTVTLTGSDGSTTSVSDSDTKYGLQLQNGKLKLVEGGSTSEITLPDNNTTYTISISGHTITLTPSSGTAQSVTVPDDNTTYTISKSGSTVTLTGSDGSTSTFTDANTTYTAGAGLSLSGTEFSAKTGFTTSGNNRAVQTDTNGNLYVVQKDSNTTYSLTQDASDGHKITLTPSSGTAQTVTIPDNDTKYTAGTGLSLSGTQFSANLGYTTSGNNRAVLADSNGKLYVTQKDDNTTYTAGAGLSLSGTEFSAKTGYTTSGNNRKVQTDANGNLYVIQKDDNTTYTAGAGLSLSGTEFSAKTGYTTSGNNRKVQTDSNGNLYVIQKDDNTTYTAGTGLSLSGTTFNHSNSVTAVTSDSLLKVKYDAQGHITGSSSVAKADITALGIPGSDTNNRRAFYGTCSTAAGTAAKTVTLSSTAGWELVAGTIVGVKFTYTNTAQNPTLNVNSTGAKSIWYGQAVLTTGNLNKAGYASRVEYYMYDGTNWVWINWGIDDNSTYYLQTYTTRQTDADVAWHSNSYIKYLLASSTMTANKPQFTGDGVAKRERDAQILHLSWDNNGGWDAQLATTNGGDLLSSRGGAGKEGDVQKWTDWVSYARADHAVDTITRSGTTFTATRADGTTFTFDQKDDNTTYTAGTGLSLSGTQFSVKTGYTTSGNNRKVQADSSGNLYVVQKDSDTTYSAGTGLSLSDTTFNHSNSVTALTTEGLRKIKYDAQGHITGSTAVAKADITGLGIPGSDTNNRRGFYGTCSTAAGTAAKTVTLSSTAGWELVAGTIVGVKFTNTNSASNPTLNVNSSGAKSIWYNTGVITTGNKAGYANRITYYMYDGSHWVWMGWSIDDNTWQSNTNARAGYVASGANQDTKVWKTDEDGNPAWRDERITVFPAISYTGASASTTVNIPNGTITQVPLTREVFHLVGNVGNALDSNADYHCVAIEGDTGYYRITASVYITPTAAAMVGVYIMQGNGNFAGATEIASSFSYATSGGAVNVTKTIKIVGPASRDNIYLGARVMGTTGKAYTGNVATYLEVEQIG